MSNPPLRIGTVGPTQPPGTQFADTVSRIETKSWDSVWWPDHFMGWYPQSVWTADLVDVVDRQPSPHTMFETLSSLGYAAAVTDQVQIGTHVTQPLRRHPITLAQAFQTLHHLTGGRMILGFGPGERKDSTPYGVEYEWQVSKFEEALEIIQRGWETDLRETFDYDGRFWTLEDAVLDLPPVETEGVPSHPPIWIGAHGPRMLSLTGRFGDGWLPASLPPETYRSSWDRVAESAREAGRDPDDITCAVSLPVIIDETTEDCEELLDSLLVRLDCLQTPAHVYEQYGHEHPLGDGFNGLSDLVPSRLTREQALEAAEQVPMGVIDHTHVWGSPDDVVASLREYVDAGARHFVLLNQTHLADIEQVGTSFGLLDEVIDRLRE